MNVKQHFEHYICRGWFDRDPSFVVYAKSLLNAFFRLLESKTVLEIGFGNGTLLYNLCQRATAPVYGVDLSHIACLQVKAFCRNTAQMSATALAFASESVGAVASTMTIEHCDDRAMLNEIHRILQPGGILFITTVLRGGGCLVLP